MTAQAYIQSKLADLRQPLGLEKPAHDDQLVDAISKAILSKKFRKYSASPELIEHIRGAVRINVEKHEPINVTFLHGAYKLWRLEEAPEADWAELFALMYYTNWLKPVCELYEPGVWFDLFLDDLIPPKLNNIPQSDIETYVTSYQAVIDFLKQYQPANFKTTVTRVGDFFESPAAFDKALQRNLEVLTAKTPGGLPILSEDQKASVELNTKVTVQQLKDPKWREKVFHLHNAYMGIKADTGYHKNRPEKILAFNQPVTGGKMISVGSTKDSVAKFWVGVGVLKPKDGSYRQLVLTPKQLQHADYTTEAITLNGLSGKNFAKIRIMTT